LYMKEGKTIRVYVRWRASTKKKKKKQTAILLYREAHHEPGEIIKAWASHTVGVHRPDSSYRRRGMQQFVGSGDRFHRRGGGGGGGGGGGN